MALCECIGNSVADTEGTQRDRKRGKKSRPPVVVKAPSVLVLLPPPCSLRLFLILPSPAAPPSAFSLSVPPPVTASLPLLRLSDSFSTVASLYETPLRRWKQNNSSGPELHNGSGPFFSPIAHFSAHCSAPRQRERERDGEMHAGPPRNRDREG